MNKTKNPKSSSYQIMGGRLRGITDSDYFYFRCPSCKNILQITNYETFLNQPPSKEIEETAPAIEKIFIIGLKLHCSSCFFEDYIKITNTARLEGKIKEFKVLGEINDVFKYQIPEDINVVYFIQSTINGLIKIGRTTDLIKRFRGLQVDSPVPLKLIMYIEDDSKQLERELHDKFRDICSHGEWFTPSYSLLEFILKSLLDGRGKMSDFKFNY